MDTNVSTLPQTTKIAAATMPEKQVIPMHRKHLPQLDAEDVKYEIASDHSCFLDMVYIRVEPTAENLLFLFHAGMRIGKKGGNA